MRTPSITWLLMLALVAIACEASADSREDVAQLDRLVAEIERTLPAGWVVEFEAGDERVRDSRPRLVVRSAEKLPVEYLSAIGAPAADANSPPYVVHEHVSIVLSLAPSMSPEEYSMVREQNEAREKKRRQFEEIYLKRRQSNYKGGFTPASFERVTGDKSPALREYALLWLNTEPRPLPTHHYGTLSLVAYDLPGQSSISVKIHDESRQREFDQIVRGLEKLLVPYELAQR